MNGRSGGDSRQAHNIVGIAERMQVGRALAGVYPAIFWSTTLRSTIPVGRRKTLERESQRFRVPRPTERGGSNERSFGWGLATGAQLSESRNACKWGERWLEFIPPSSGLRLFDLRSRRESTDS